MEVVQLLPLVAILQFPVLNELGVVERFLEDVRQRPLTKKTAVFSCILAVCIEAEAGDVLAGKAGEVLQVCLVPFVVGDQVDALLFDAPAEPLVQPFKLGRVANVAVFIARGIDDDDRLAPLFVEQGKDGGVSDDEGVIGSQLLFVALVKTVAHRLVQIMPGMLVDHIDFISRLSEDPCMPRDAPRGDFVPQRFEMNAARYTRQAKLNRIKVLRFAGE